jgi:uncharacterized protein YuzE
MVMDKRIITYDPEADAAYIYVGGQPGETMGRKEGGETMSVSDDIILDLDENGALHGIEILNASRYGVPKCGNWIHPKDLQLKPTPPPHRDIWEWGCMIVLAITAFTSAVGIVVIGVLA